MELIVLPTGHSVELNLFELVDPFLRAAFTSADPNSAKKTVKSSSFLRFQDLRVQKLHVNC